VGGAPVSYSGGHGLHFGSQAGHGDRIFMVFLNPSRQLPEEYTDIKLDNDSFINLYLIICCLFNDDVSISDYTASNVRTIRPNNEMETM
jgi:hypothetical protein